MTPLNLIAIAVGLAMDALAVAIAAGISLKALNRGHVARMALAFGFFQALMPILGWLAGRTVEAYVSAFDHWVAFGLLVFLGGKMLWQAAHGGEEGAERADPTRGLTLLMLSVATSIDALAVGLSLAFLRVSIWTPSLVIGLVCAVLTALGVRFGSALGPRFGRWAEGFGGLVLVGIGVKIVLSHLGAAP